MNSVLTVRDRKRLCELIISLIPVNHPTIVISNSGGQLLWQNISSPEERLGKSRERRGVDQRALAQRVMLGELADIFAKSRSRELRFDLGNNSLHWTSRRVLERFVRAQLEFESVESVEVAS